MSCSCASSASMYVLCETPQADSNSLCVPAMTARPITARSLPRGDRVCSAHTRFQRSSSAASTFCTITLLSDCESPPPDAGPVAANQSVTSTDSKLTARGVPKVLLKPKSTSSPATFRGGGPSDSLLETFRGEGSPDLHIGHPPVTDRTPVHGKIKNILQERRPHSRQSRPRPDFNSNNNNTLKVEQVGILLQTVPSIPKRSEKRETREKETNARPSRPEEPSLTGKGPSVKPVMHKTNITSSSTQANPNSHFHLPAMNGDTDELVAMGTNWEPSGQLSNKLQTNQSGSGSLLLPGSSQPLSFIATSVGGLTAPIAMSQRYRSRASLRDNANKNAAAVQPLPPKYADGFADASFNAPLEFTQRIAEFATLEADTIRWEKARKVKKKLKADS